MGDVFGGFRFCEGDGGAYCYADVAGAGPMFVGFAQIVEAFEAHGDYRDAQAGDEEAYSCAERADGAIGREHTLGENQDAPAAVHQLTGKFKTFPESGAHG